MLGIAIAAITRISTTTIINSSTAKPFGRAIGAPPLFGQRTVGARKLAENQRSSALRTAEGGCPHIYWAELSVWLLRRRHVLFWLGRAFAEKEHFQLLHDYFLIFAAGGIQAIFVEQHLAVLHPHPPGFLRDVVVNLLAEFVVEWGLFQAGHIFF